MATQLPDGGRRGNRESGSARRSLKAPSPLAPGRRSSTARAVAPLVSPTSISNFNLLAGMGSLRYRARIMDSNDIPPIGSTPPPPFNPPPVIISAVPTRPRKSRGWMIVAIVLLVLLVLSLFVNFSQFFFDDVPIKEARIICLSAGPPL